MDEDLLVHNTDVDEYSTIIDRIIDRITNLFNNINCGNICRSFNRCIGSIDEQIDEHMYTNFGDRSEEHHV